MPHWIVLTRYGSILILLLLNGLSIWSVSIIVDRYRFFQKLRKQLSFLDFEKELRSHSLKDLSSWLLKMPVSLPQKTALLALDLNTPHSEAIDRAVKSQLVLEKKEMEKGFTVLATLGSNAPFIGLFGTVLGIIEAFGQLSSAEANTQAVIGGVSEALVATAIGLFVAIPAVVAFNYFSQLSKAALSEAEVTRDVIISKILSEKNHGR